ncbi:MAG: type II toxin-antitoxin system Phd/YefM family antitoxin [Gemmatimonadota bacterium]|nr:MAG: type II toxin-antitoxin system Phd/YefM family antitoxin [Gemmatimonadota bacterium]
MDPLHISEDIVPLGEFKTHASQVLRRVRERGRPIVITQNGRPAAVLLAPEEFDRLVEKRRFTSAVESGLSDSVAGVVVDDEDLDSLLIKPFPRADTP